MGCTVVFVSVNLNSTASDRKCLQLSAPRIMLRNFMWCPLCVCVQCKRLENLVLSLKVLVVRWYAYMASPRLRDLIGILRLCSEQHRKWVG